MLGMKMNIKMTMINPQVFQYFQTRNLQEYEEESTLKTKTIKSHNMEEFDLQKAKNGASLITRNGKKAKSYLLMEEQAVFPLWLNWRIITIQFYTMRMGVPIYVKEPLMVLVLLNLIMTY